MNRRTPPRILCVAGPSGSGKTTLIAGIVPHLPVPRARLGLLKHTHHRIEWHPEGKDSRRLRDLEPGALGVVGPGRTAVFLSGDEEEDPTRRLVRACSRLPRGLELVLAEGFTGADAPTLWVDARGRPPEGLDVPGLRGVAVPAGHVRSWEEAGVEVPVFSRDDLEELAARAAGWAAAPGTSASG